MSDPAASRARPKVIYVMGAGHSGSTILGVALGNCAEIFYAGEVMEWLANSARPVIGGSERTRFWRAVGERVGRAGDLYGRPNRYLERSSAILRLDRWPTRHRMRPRYRRVTEDLFHAIAAEARASYVVDTSHFPLRARELQHLEGIDLYLLFLVRSPQGVVASETRHIRRHHVAERRVQVVLTNARLWLTYLLSVLVFVRHAHDRRLFVRHEDFLAAPHKALREILDFVGSDAEIPDLQALSTGIPLFGNPLIRSEVVALESPPAKFVSRSPVTTLLQAPWRLIFSRLQPTVRV
jgi:Sulfotransferase domain